MSKELIGTSVLDFDGTVTDGEKEAVLYIESYIETLVKIFNINEHELREILENERQEVLNNPAVYGWEYNGLIVAPAVADPILIHQASVRLLIKELRRDGGISNLPSPDSMTDFLNQMHSSSYPHSGTHFKDGARDFIQELQAKSDPVVVVTNSETRAVMAKLESLFGKEDKVRVIGNARKYVVDLEWQSVPKSALESIPALIQPSGFPMPVYLRRPEYYRVLKELKGPKRVIGDIYTLDLALPEAMGLTTVLVPCPTTPQWERDYYDGHEKGFIVDSLDKIIPGFLCISD